ncbi:MAG: pantetheine-phosphate adenylyltransferase [Acetobacteraceae bacterium]
MPEGTGARPIGVCGVYPGTFDPVTNGHLDIIARAARILPRLVIGVATNIGKAPIFPLPERAELVRGETEEIARRTGSKIEVRPFDGLLVAFARAVGAGVIVRGLRVVADFDYEFQMAGMNYRLDSDVETVFLMASERHQFISSRFVREIAELGGDVSSFVPSPVLIRMRERLPSRTQQEFPLPLEEVHSFPSPSGRGT